MYNQLCSSSGVFVLTAIIDIFCLVGFFFFSILGYLKTLDIISKYESKRMGHLD